MTIVVTGAGGFVGGHLVEKLKNHHQACVGIVRRDSGRNSELVWDLLSRQSIPVADLKDVDTVVHCASVLPVSGRTDFTENVVMTSNLLSQLPESTQCFVLLSSVSVYPLDEGQTVSTDETCTDFSHSAYGASKRRQEELVTDWAQRTRTRLVIFRPASVYGSHAKGDSILPQMCRSAAAGRDIDLFAPANYRQNFIAVQDVCNAVVAAINTNVDGTFNLFSDDTFSARQLAERIVSDTASSSRIVEHESSEEVPRVLFCNRRLKEVFEPVFRDFTNEIRAMCRSYRLSEESGAPS